jgi:uncharacterized protein YqeY
VSQNKTKNIDAPQAATRHAPYDAEKQKLDSNDPLVVLMRENAKHRNTIEELRRILRTDLPQDTDGLCIQQALRVAMNERDKACEAVTKIKNMVANIKKMASHTANNDISDECEKILKSKL